MEKGEAIGRLRLNENRIWETKTFYLDVVND